MFLLDGEPGETKACWPTRGLGGGGGRQRGTTKGEARHFCQSNFDSSFALFHCLSKNYIAPLLFIKENAVRQEKLEREMSELKESTLAEEEVVRLVELKCAKLRQEILSPFSLKANVVKLFLFVSTQHNNYHVTERTCVPRRPCCCENLFQQGRAGREDAGT